MNKRNLILKMLAIALVCLICTNTNAQQKEYPKPGQMRPDMSEFWTPQPPIVTPGTYQGDGLLTPPSDAIILFDGKDLSAWENFKGGPAEWTVQNGTFTVVGRTGEIRTKQKFENFQLHIEWASPKEVRSASQGRGNSGVFLQGMYEVQILDCYENETYANGMTGSIYKQTAPLVNAMRKPGEWNTYDIIYSAPIFKEDGTYRVPPRVTVIQNGIVLQNNTTILGTTEFIGFPKVTPHGAGPIVLQDHGNPVSFRNIWIREL